MASGNGDRPTEPDREETPYTPERIGAVRGRADIPMVTLAHKPPELEEPPPPPADAPPNTRGLIYEPAAAQDAEGAPLAGQCEYCGCWYFWPVESTDGVELLQCVSCYRLYRRREA